MIGITSVQTMKELTAHKKIVLVGTYWTGQFSKWRGYYNYPIDEAVEVAPEAYGDIASGGSLEGSTLLGAGMGSMIR